MDNDNPSKTGSCIYFVAIAGLFLIMAWLVWYMNDRTNPGPLGGDRAAKRLEARQAASEADAAGLEAYGWINKDEGIAQIPVDRAMEIVEQEWHDPAKARAELITRAERAAKTPEPAAPPAQQAKPAAAEAPSAFE